MKILLAVIASSLTLSAMAKPVSFNTRLDILKTLANAKTAKVTGQGNGVYSMSNLISDLDKALGANNEKNASYQISRLDCDDKGTKISCDILIYIENYSTMEDGNIETFESGVMIKANLLKSKSGLKLEKNAVDVTIAG